MKTKFRIVDTSDYILAVSDEEIQTGYYYNDLDNELRKGYAEQSYHTSVIAYAPKGNALELEGLPLLPEIVVEDDVENELNKEFYIFEGLFNIIKTTFSMIWRSGYRAATKVYSEEDLRKAFEEGIEARELDVNEDTDIPWSNYIQSLKQPKTPQFFVAEMETSRIPYGDDGWKTIETGYKTTETNGKTYLVGTYIY